MATSNTVSQTYTENLDWTINWNNRGLQGDTVASSSFTQSSNEFTLSNFSLTTTTTTFWLTGGIPGKFYTITNTIITAGGRTLQETMIYECLPQRML